MAGEEKTEKATPKKRKDAREKDGNVLQSKEVTTMVSVLGMFIILSLLAKFIFQILLNCVTDWVSALGDNVTINEEFITKNAINMLVVCVLTLGPMLVAAMFLGSLPVTIQTKGLFSMKSLKPKFSKLNPFSGIKRLFSLQSLIGILKGIIEIIAVVAIVYNQIMGLLDKIKLLPDMEVIQGVVFTADSIFNIVILISVVFAFVAAGDFIFQWWNYEKKLKMSKQEVKDEYKQIDGDPQIKAKIKQKQREIAQNRMMQDVPTSDVVVRNPTHYAVALKYSTDNIRSAPIVVAKGKDNLALKIIDIASENDIFIKEDRPLARTLYETVEVGKEIPFGLYNAIATVLSEMYEVKGIKPKLSTGKNNPIV